MPRHNRIEITGAVYHVITRGIERRAIYKDDTDREEFVKRLSTALKETKSMCYGWALMPNHFHLVIRSGVKPLSTLMRKVLTGYAVYFNRRHKRSGYLYQNRYKSILCQEETYLLELIRYIHLNPLRAGIVKDMGRLKTYRWSGHAVLMGKRKNDWQETGEILIRFGQKRSEARGRYEDFISEGQTMGLREDLCGGGLRRSAGGWAGVRALAANKERWRSDERILGDGDFVSSVLKESEERISGRVQMINSGWDIERIVAVVIKEFGIQKEDLFRKGRNSKSSWAKMIIAYLATNKLGMGHTAVAHYFKISKSAIIRAAQKGEVLNKKYGIELSVK